MAAPYIPSPQEIEERAKKIREERTEHEWELVEGVPQPYVVPHLVDPRHRDDIHLKDSDE